MSSRFKIILAVIIFVIVGGLHFWLNDKMMTRLMEKEKQEWAERDRQAIELKKEQAKLIQEIKKYAGSGKCKKQKDCQVIGLGAKTCDGYRTFFYYSVKTVKKQAFMNAVQLFNRNQEDIEHNSYVSPSCGTQPVEVSCVNAICVPNRKLGAEVSG